MGKNLKKWGFSLPTTRVSLRSHELKNCYPFIVLRKYKFYAKFHENHFDVGPSYVLSFIGWEHMELNKKLIN
jgi:hypothetical protein